MRWKCAEERYCKGTLEFHLEDIFRMLICRSHAPSHGTREVLIIYGALLSSDPGDIHETITNLIAERIRVSIVGLSAQVAICAELCSKTNAGDESQYNVAMDEMHNCKHRH